MMGIGPTRRPAPHGRDPQRVRPKNPPAPPKEKPLPEIGTPEWDAAVQRDAIRYLSDLYKD